MKTNLLWLGIVLVLCIGLAAFLACGDDDDEEDDEDEGGEEGDDDDAGNNCASMPDMMAMDFTFYDTNGFFGTDFSFTEIQICNAGGLNADPGSVFGFYLVTGADFTGDYYIVAKSEPLVGIAAGECQTFTLNATSSEAPEGNYYVYIVADSEDVIAECNESNNWARSDNAVHVKPDETE